MKLKRCPNMHYYDEDKYPQCPHCGASASAPKAEPKPAEKAAAPKAAVPELPKPSSETQGTWLVSTTMGGVFSKYVFICSKCGYKKESFLSVAPTSNCPECEKNK